MKRIALSLMTIAAVVVVAVGATSAYFKDIKVVDGNTFATGTVVLGATSPNGIVLTNLVPSVPRTYDISQKYVGSVNADVYIGARGTSMPGNPQYLGDKMWVNIKDKDTGTHYYNGWVSGLSTAWRNVGTNVGQNDWKNYTLTFTLDSSFEGQGVTNTDTEVLIYAVQTGGPVPSTVPYLTNTP